MDPVEVKQIATAAISGGFIVFLGAVYALFFALGQLRRSSLFLQISYGSFVLFLAATWVFTNALELSGIWLWLIATLVVGYFIAPRFIWRLSVATHDSEPDQGESQ